MVINANQEINIPINEKLVWDYDIPENAQQNEAFLRWYLARVLTRGSADDLRDTGIKMISVYLPDLSLPRDIRAFWEWYLDLPAVKKRYGITDAITEAVA
ncbi:MAG: hypothetical protein WBD56_09500 [Anaerolineales bacterium]|jgi:hypothetical protein